MDEMVLVTGGSGSGKSAYAEELVLAAGERRRIYVATMLPYGKEGQHRVERHRRLRAGKGFETVERYTDLAGLRLPAEPDGGRQSGLSVDLGRESKPAVLLECISNLAANELYEPAGAGTRTVEAVTRGVEVLRGQSALLVVVTNEVFSDGIRYDPSTAQYLEYLGRINRNLARMADRIAEVVCGIPMRMR